jgi:hypothetical protein
MPTTPAEEAPEVVCSFDEAAQHLSDSIRAVANISNGKIQVVRSIPLDWQLVLIVWVDAELSSNGSAEGSRLVLPIGDDANYIL